MQTYRDVVANGQGVPVAGASVLVKSHPDGAVATLFDANGNSLGNPFTSTDGTLVFAAANGKYTITLSGGGIRGVSVTPPITLYDPADAQPATLSALAATGGAALVGNGTETVADSLNALQLADYTALRAYAGPRKSVYVTGYLGTAAPSGIAGMFVRDDTDTTTADNGGTVIVDASGKRWKRAYEGAASLKWFGAKVDGTTDDALALRTVAATGEVDLRNGSMLVKSGAPLANTVYVHGRAALSQIKAAADFAAGTDMFTVSPAAGATEKRNIQFRDFMLANAGSNVKNWFTLDVTNAGQYLNKFELRGVVADVATGYFVELVNPTNADGLFSSHFSDNWSMNGYRLERVGDSVICERNTVSGSGAAFYVNEIGTASHVIIKDSNLTSDGGALRAMKSMNLRFDNNQVEMPNAFTGADNALVSFNSATSAVAHQNPQVTRNNLNAQNNAANTALRCLYANWTDNLKIEDNTLFCNPTTGTHIYIDSGCNDTYIGGNRYYSTLTGAQITPIISDNGQGTMGIWKNATLATSWALASATNGFPVGYFKTRDGLVVLRGNLVGAAPGSAMLLFTLPVGFRPNTKVITTYKPFNGTTSCAVQIEPNGNVTLLTTTATGVYLDGMTFSTR